jgi:hypothetical protein
MRRTRTPITPLAHGAIDHATSAAVADWSAER